MTKEVFRLLVGSVLGVGAVVGIFTVRIANHLNEPPLVRTGEPIMLLKADVSGKSVNAKNATSSYTYSCWGDGSIKIVEDATDETMRLEFTYKHKASLTRETEKTHPVSCSLVLHVNPKGFQPNSPKDHRVWYTEKEKIKVEAAQKDREETDQRRAPELLRLAAYRAEIHRLEKKWHEEDEKAGRKYPYPCKYYRQNADDCE
jgi:hypothetical protein